MNQKDKVLAKADIYILTKLTKIKILALALILGVLGFLFNFPFSQYVENKIAGLIAQNKKCPIEYRKLKMEWLLPKIIIDEPNIGGRCFKSPGKNIKFDQVKLTFYGPSYLPPGIRFLTEIKQTGHKLESYLSLSFNKAILKIPKTNIQSKLVKKAFSGEQYFNGNIDIEGIFELKENALDNASFLITSDKITVLAQNIQGFNTPALPLDLLNIKGSLQNKKDMKIESFKLGKSGAPIILDINGSITLNQLRVQSSKFDLKGKVNFTPSFIEKFGFINFLISNKKTKNGFYHFELKGPASSLKPKFL